MIVFSVYPGDPRVRRAGEALTDGGMQVDVICLSEGDSAAFEVVRGVNVYRMPLQRKRSKRSRYLYEYSSFGLWAFFRAAGLHTRRRYALIHVHNMPDALVFSALIPRLCGAKLILDLHDPMPEVFMAKYGESAEHWLIRLLLKVEKISLGFSHLGLTPNIAFRKLFIARSCPPDKMKIVMNSPQENIFNGVDAEMAAPASVPTLGYVIMYHGTIVERHGLDTAVEAVARLRKEIPGLKFHVYGSGDAFVEQFCHLVNHYQVSDIVEYHGPQALEAIAQQIRCIDLGIIPNRHSAFTDINFPTRIFEYLAMGKPVIAPRTHGILDYFDDDSMFFFEPGSVDSLTAAILRTYHAPDTVAAILRRGLAIYAQHKWQQEKTRYLDAVEELCESKD